MVKRDLSNLNFKIYNSDFLDKDYIYFYNDFLRLFLSCKDKDNKIEIHIIEEKRKNDIFDIIFKAKIETLKDFETILRLIENGR